MCQGQVPHLPEAHPDLAQLLREAADLRGAARLGKDEPSVANGAETAVVAGVANMTLSGGDESLGAQAPGAPPTPVPRPPAPPGEPPVGGGLLHAQSMPVMKPAGGTSSVPYTHPTLPTNSDVCIPRCPRPHQT